MRSLRSAAALGMTRFLLGCVVGAVSVMALLVYEDLRHPEGIR